MERVFLVAATAAIALLLCAPAEAQRQSFQLFRGNEADLPALVAGEPAFTLDTKKLWIGDATTNWSFWPKVQLDAVYSALGHTHAASEIVSGNLDSARMPADGMTTVVTIHHGLNDTTDCTVTFTNGRVTATTCSHT